MHVCEWDMCWRNFVTFLWWLKNVKSRSKIALFSNECHFEIWFPKKKTITFFWSKLSKLHKKRPNFACGNSFSQGETRTNSVPIPHPLTKMDPTKSGLPKQMIFFFFFTSEFLSNFYQFWTTLNWNIWQKGSSIETSFPGIGMKRTFNVCNVSVSFLG